MQMHLRPVWSSGLASSITVNSGDGASTHARGEVARRGEVMPGFFPLLCLANFDYRDAVPLGDGQGLVEESSGASSLPSILPSQR